MKKKVKDQDKRTLISPFCYAYISPKIIEKNIINNTNIATNFVAFLLIIHLDNNYIVSLLICLERY
jgi:hypothetical protein